MPSNASHDPVSCLNRLKAAAGNLELLDERWRGALEQYHLRCPAGHIWSRSADMILYHGPVACPECVNIRRFARLVAAVEQTGSVCLDTGWRGAAAKYRFRCANGHLWQRSANSVFKKKTACPKCMRKAIAAKALLADGLERLRATAAAQGGECLADRYLGTTARYRFRCRQGHEWETVGNTVLNNHYWCPRCGYERGGRANRNPERFARLQAVAAAKGGVCLSETYAGGVAYYRFRCRQGHEWETTGQTILKGCWCARCANDARRTDIAVFHAIAAARGGQCLSETYHDSRIKLTWMCHKGHVWQALAGSVKGGTWCPDCANENMITRRDSLARIRYGKALNTDG